VTRTLTHTTPSAPTGAPAVPLRRIGTPEYEITALGYELRARRHGGSERRFLLQRRHPADHGWTELAEGAPTSRVSVLQLADLLLRDTDAEDLIYALTERAIDEAALLREASTGREREAWRNAARRLEGQLEAARARRRLPNERLRRRFLALEREDKLTAAEACRRLGYLTADGRADTTRLKRRLGLTPSTDRITGRPVLSTHLKYETAAAIARALDMAPADIGA
jgi:hypothetical protein